MMTKKSLLLSLLLIGSIASNSMANGWTSKIARTVVAADTIASTFATLVDTSYGQRVDKQEAYRVFAKIDVDTAFALQAFRVVWQYNVKQPKAAAWWTRFDSTAFRLIPIDTMVYLDSLVPSELVMGRFVRGIVEYKDSLGLNGSAADTLLLGKIYNQKIQIYMEEYKR